MAPITIVETKAHADNQDKESSLLLKQAEKITQAPYFICLDERGRSFSSIALAEELSNRRDQGKRNFVFFLGGAYGLSEAVRARSDLVLSLSAMTLPHDLARIFILEQIYRSLHIQRKTGYHHA